MDKRLPKMQISDKVLGIPEALSVYFNNLVYQLKRDGSKITVLSLGEAFFDIPKLELSENALSKGYHYSESMGIPELRACIADYYKKNYGVPVDADTEILVSAGSKPLVFMALQAILNPGDEVLMHEPAWLSYPEQIKLAGGVPKFIPYYEDVDDFPKYFGSHTRALILNNPNNPAGSVYDKEKLKRLYEECRSRGIYIISDEAYSDFVLDDSFMSMGAVSPEKDGVIVVNSLSKNFGMSGWRIGYVIGNPEFIRYMLKLNQHLITCPATVIAMYLAEHFDEIQKATVPQARKVVVKRNEIRDYMHEIGLKTLDGDATFYTFVDITGYGRSSLDFGLYLLLKYHIAVVPGSAYGASTDHFIRVGVGAESDEDLKAAVRQIKAVLDHKEYDEEFVNGEMERLHLHYFS